MVSTLNWLDVSAEQQRRVRDIIKLFEEPGTRDELGIGTIRDGFSEIFFPGTAVVQTRARYFLFVPWHFIEARRRFRGEPLLRRAEATQRNLIMLFLKANVVDGLIGRQAQDRLRILPSSIYWSGLQKLGILTSPMTPQAVSLADTAPTEADEFVEAHGRVWHPTLPPPPEGFFAGNACSFDLTRTEAEWLSERIVERVGSSLLAHFVRGAALVGTDSPWDEPSALDAPPVMRDTLEHARRFSLLAHGAALLHNVLIAEAYEARGLTAVSGVRDRYRDELAEWREDIADEPNAFAWDWPGFWHAVSGGNTNVSYSARNFVESWVHDVGQVPANALADHAGLRTLVEQRVTKLRGGRSVLRNDKLLALWRGSTGALPLTYRWGTVQRLIGDIQEGMNRAGA